MTNILNKLFPRHSTGTAIVICVFSALTLLVAGFTLAEEAYTANYVLMAVFAAVAGLTYAFDKRD